jgi:hypothetical protein
VLQSEEVAMANRSKAGKKAAKKRRAAGKNAARTRKLRAAGKKAALTRKRRAAGLKAVTTRKLKKEQTVPAPPTSRPEAQVAEPKIDDVQQ